MGWFSNAGDGVNSSFASLPDWFQKSAKVILFSAFGIVVVATLAEVAWTSVTKIAPVTAADIQSARNRLEFERLQVEATETSRIAQARANADIEMEAARAEAHRLTLGLPSKFQPKSTDNLAALAEVVTTHLPTILAIMFAVYLLPAFATTGDPWRLSLNIAAAIVVSGLFALIKGVTSPSSMEMKGSIGSVAVSSASVGLFLMVFGTLLAGFSLYMLNRNKSKK